MRRRPKWCGSVLALVVCALAVGCTDESLTSSQQPPAKPKMTDDIGEFDPAAGKEVVQPDVQISNPITGALEAYQPLRQKVAALGIEHAVNLFQALEGRYPKDHDEFMEKVIRANNMRLPELPGGLAYQYDVENHKLVVIREDTGAAID